MEVLFFAAILGLIPAVIARHKGRSFVGFWIYGTLLFIVALPHALLMKPDTRVVEARQLEGGSHRKCPHCAEIIRIEAKVCRFCGRDVGTVRPGDDPRYSTPLTPEGRLIAAERERAEPKP